MSRAATKKIQELGFHKPERKVPSRVVFLMRGCPASGKSFTAKKLAGNTGIVCETDSYFGTYGRNYHFNIKERPVARDHNMKLFLDYLRLGYPIIVVDRGCGKGKRTWWYAKTAQLFGYTVKLAEPTSLWWEAIRRMLSLSSTNRLKYIQLWAKRLAKKQEKTHRVGVKAIMKSLAQFNLDLTVEDILREGK